MSAQLRFWAKALGGEVSGANVRCPGPCHSPVDRSLSVQVSVASPDGFVVHSFANDDWRDCHNYVCAKLGIEPFAPHRAVPAPRLPHVAPVTSVKSNVELALLLWNQAADPRGTLVEAYLKSRRLELPNEAANESIRFLASCPFVSEHFPAMVCLVRNIVTNEPQGIHRTALMPDGAAIKRNGKTYRLSLAHTDGGAIKLDPDEERKVFALARESRRASRAGKRVTARHGSLDLPASQASRSYQALTR